MGHHEKKNQQKQSEEHTDRHPQSGRESIHGNKTAKQMGKWTEKTLWKTNKQIVNKYCKNFSGSQKCLHENTN